MRHTAAIAKIDMNYSGAITQAAAPATEWGLLDLFEGGALMWPLLFLSVIALMVFMVAVKHAGIVVPLLFACVVDMAGGDG